MRKMSYFAVAAMLACGLAPAAARAQADWPARPITMVVPFTPGGVSDNIARPVAEAMGRALGQTVVVENRGGAAGRIGIAHVAKSAPDGYTILMSLPSISILPETDKVMGREPMFTLGQFRPIARITADTVVLAVRADSPWKTIGDYVAEAHKRDITYGSPGTYGALHIFMEAFKSAANLRLQHVPYAGAAPAVVDVLGGQIESIIGSPASVMQQVKAGRLRVLAHWGTGRIASLPDVPSLTEAGYPVSFAQWSGVFVPAATPSAVVDKLRAAARFAAQDAKVRQAIEDVGISVQYQDAAEFQAYWRDDTAKLAAAVQKIGKID
ncbi:tripartite tricarboxylate transporter substrate binding protein [Pigmentiphaga soli]|uniref:Tripartite tricarboxylate transporter substrate binding protein n=1 Tax=Pigmentiphaga soli TaxID=1007095 RepID=A0ABP8HS94_9BURK